MYLVQGGYLVPGGVPGPGGCTWSQGRGVYLVPGGGVPGPGGAPGLGGVPGQVPPREQNHTHLQKHNLAPTSLWVVIK